MRFYGNQSHHIQRLDDAIKWPHATFPAFLSQSTSFRIPELSEEINRYSSTPPYDPSLSPIATTTTTNTAASRNMFQESYSFTQLLSDYQLWAIILSLFPVATVFGNILVVMSVIREVNLHTATNYFIVSLAAADISLALLVMPLSGWVEANNGLWLYGTVLCDIFIMLDVLLCTASILNLAAISIDRYVAVTKPLIYSRHSNNFRVAVTIASTWILSLLIALPIVCGLNNVTGRQPDACVSYNPQYIITSSIGSFYIPFIVMCILYYQIFRTIRHRAKVKTHTLKVPNRASDETHSGQTFAPSASNHSLPKTGVTTTNETALPSPTVNVYLLNPHNGLSDDVRCSTNEIPNRIDAHTNITEIEATSNFKPEFKDMDEFRKHLRARIRQAKRRSLTMSPVPYLSVGGQSVYVSNQAVNPSITTRNSTKSKLFPRRHLSANRPISQSERLSHADQHNAFLPTGGMKDLSSVRSLPETHASQRKRWLAPGAVQCKSHQLPREKLAARREKKVTKTLAIVLGVFLICWLPFFTCNIIHAFCFIAQHHETTGFCNIHHLVDSITVWLGYINSFLNPIIYTIFNAEFRKAFKKILHCN